MKKLLSSETKFELRSEISLLKSKEDLILLLNKVATIIYDDNISKPFDVKHLSFYASPLLSKNRYSSFEIKKRSGSLRTINAPKAGLKSILKCLAVLFESVYEANKSVTGFVSGKSIVDNALQHVNREFVYNIDLKDFFHSFDRNRVKMCVWGIFFNYNKEQEQLAFIIASLCTHPLIIDDIERIVLPQGSPTSPILTNILCEKLDRRLQGLAKRFRIRYTRYADDITFSSNFNVFEDDNFLNELSRIITDQNLLINSDKTRLQKRGFRQEVTGLIVNDKVNVHRRYIKQIRMWIYYMEKYGIEKAEDIFRKDYTVEKGHVKRQNNPMFNVISGKLLYLKMVKGENNSTYIKLQDRFEKSINSVNVLKFHQALMKNNRLINAISKVDEIDLLFNVWESEGIDKAMQQFYVSNTNNS